MKRRYVKQCVRCGRDRILNEGKNRRARETGLCRDCYHILYPGGRGRPTPKETT